MSMSSVTEHATAIAEAFLLFRQRYSRFVAAHRPGITCDSTSSTENEGIEMETFGPEPGWTLVSGRSDGPLVRCAVTHCNDPNCHKSKP